MKSTNYSRFCLKLFKKIFTKKIREVDFEKKIRLVKANIEMEYEEYNSMALMNSILAFFFTYIPFLVLYLLIPNDITLFFLLIFPLIILLAVALTYIYLPKYLINARANNIDRFLPYAINFISSMAEAGVSPKEIFQTLSKVKVYGEIQREANRITKEIVIMGIDNITALKNAIELSPSKKYDSFLQGIIGTIQSGSDLHSYLVNISKKYLEDELIERKKNLDFLSVIAETFVISVIAFPVFLVIIMTTMGFFGGSMEISITILLLFSFLILPFVYLGFYAIINSATAKRVGKFIKEEQFGFKHFYKEQKKSIFVLILSIIFAIIFSIIVYFLGTVDLIYSGRYLIYDIIFLDIIIILGPIGFYIHYKSVQEKMVQERLPEFLIEIKDSLSSGMTTFDAITEANKGHFGKLTPEISRMKAQLSWNISLKDVFSDFANRMKSAVIQRVVITINEGILMGGDTSKIFNSAAKEVHQVNQIDNHRKANMSVYMSVILMCFFIFLAIVIILDRTIFQSFFELQADQLRQSVGSININRVNPVYFKYSLFSFIYVQSIGSGVLAGYMMDAKLSSGVRYGCVLAIVSFIIFKLMF